MPFYGATDKFNLHFKELRLSYFTGSTDKWIWVDKPESRPFKSYNQARALKPYRLGTETESARNAKHTRHKRKHLSFINRALAKILVGLIETS